MPERQLPVHPDLGQLRRQAKELLRGAHEGEPDAVAEFAACHPRAIRPGDAQLADAQVVLARAYGAASWPRLVASCQMIDAIWADDIGRVRDIVTRDPRLLHEPALVRPPGHASNWGSPMSYAANLGRDRIVRMLHDVGARDHQQAVDRAVLQGKVATADMIFQLAGRPKLPEDALAGPAYTLSDSGTAFAVQNGARVVDELGRCLAPVAVVLETDSRKPAAKHAILALYERYGLTYPDTAPMAVHRGRLDLLERFLQRDPGLLDRHYPWEAVYPPEFGCGDEVLATHGTPLRGATLLHMCIDFDEMEIAEWLIARGADVNARAAYDEDGFGGHTPLFSTVVAQPNFWMNLHGSNPQMAPFTELLLRHGAEPNVRASLRKKLHPGYDPGAPLREYRDVTALGWGRRFHFGMLVSAPAMKLIEVASGVE